MKMYGPKLLISFSGEEALRVLPLAEHYQIKTLIKICGKSFLSSLAALQKEHDTGNIPVHDVMKYLSAADNHCFDKVRSVCIEELSYKSDPTRRRQIMKEKHVSDKTKLKILEKLCNKIEDDYAANLKQIRHDMDKRCREIEQRRDEFLETLETWKTHLREEVDEIFENTKSMHEKFLDEFHRKHIIEKLEKSLKYSTNEFLTEQGRMNGRIQTLFETMETNDVIGELEASKMREDWDDSQNSIKSNIETIAKQYSSRIDEILTVCSLDVQVKLASSCSLQESFSKSFTEMEEELEQSKITKIELVEERLVHEKTKSALLKMKMKEHEINTWLKWAKPEPNDEEKCLCFRHTKGKRCE